MTLYNQALAYAQQGHRVLPLNGKVPLTRHGVNDATSDPATVAAWWTAYPQANIGLAVPDGQAVIDVDPRAGGEATWQQLQAQGVPATLTAISGRNDGGRHMFFRIPPGMRLPGKLGPGVDVRQSGNYVVAAGSTHPETGGLYQWDTRGTADIAPAPQWMMASGLRPTVNHATPATTEDPRLAKAAQVWDLKVERAISDVEQTAIEAAVEAVEPVAVDGQKYHVLNKMGSVLGRRGWSEESIRAFANAFIDRYGGNDREHGVRGCVAGMRYPSGYHELCQLAGMWSAHLGRQLDSLPNPWGDELQRIKTDAASSDTAQRLLAAVNGQTHAPANVPEPEVWVSPVTGNAYALDVEPPGPDDYADPEEWHEWEPEVTSDAPDLELADEDDLTGLGSEILFDDDEIDLEYVVDGFPWHMGAVNGLVGFANTGKTPTTCALVVALASGTPFMGRSVRKGRVLVLAYESKAGTHRYLKKVARARGITIPKGSLRILGPEAGDMLNPKHIQQLKRAAARFDYVVIDTYNAGMTGVEFNDPGFASAAKLLEVDGCAVFAVLHTNKSDEGPPALKSITGTGAIAGALKAVVGLWRPDPSDKHLFEAVTVRDAGGINPPPVRFRWKDTLDGKGLDYEIVERDPAEPENAATESQSEKVTRYEAQIPGWYEGRLPDETATLADLKAYCKAESASLVERAAKSLVKQGALEPARTGKKGESVERWRRIGGPNRNGFGDRSAATRTAPSTTGPPSWGEGPLIPGDLPKAFESTLSMRESITVDEALQLAGKQTTGQERAWMKRELERRGWQRDGDKYTRREQE